MYAINCLTLWLVSKAGKSEQLEDEKEQSNQSYIFNFQKSKKVNEIIL